MYNCSMKNIRLDLRKIPSDELQKIKDEAIKMRDEGISNKEVAQRLNLDPSVLSRWYKKHIKNYRQLQVILKKGRKQGTQKKISDNLEVKIINMLQATKFLLDKKSTVDNIEAKYNITIPNTTIGDYLKKWGVNSTFIIDFKNSYRDKVGEDDFEKVMNHLSKLKLIVVWVNIKKQKVELHRDKSTIISSISSLVSKNKLVFRFYKDSIQEDDLIDFINEIATQYTKKICVFYNTEHINFSSSLDKSKLDKKVYITIV